MISTRWNEGKTNHGCHFGFLVPIRAIRWNWCANWSQHTNGLTASRLQSTCCSFKVRRWGWKIYTWTRILTFSFPITETDWLDPNTQISSTAPIAAWLLSSGRAFGTPTCAMGEIEMIIGRALYWHDATSSWTPPFTFFNAHILPSVSISLPTF